jgi:lipoprotein-releasing system permease protein
MLAPLELFLGLRYVRTREAGHFVSFITWASLLGVALGVAALITILSVMNGFEGELRERLVSLASHATLRAPEPIADWATLAATARATPGVAGVAPYVESQALITHGGAMSGAVVRGVDPAREPAVSTIGQVMVSGTLSDLQPLGGGIVLGRVLAFQLGVGLGDEVTVLVPERATEQDGVEPRMRNFAVVGVFEVGLQDHDSVLALVHLADAQALTGRPGVTGLRLKFADLYAAPRLARELAARLGGGLIARDWTEENATYFRAIRLEKTMMTLILLLVVGVAAFNIVAMLVMVVRAKRTDIAILRTLGLRPRSVVGVFLAQGVVIGWAGTLLGVVSGLTLAANVERIVPWLERTLHFHVMDADVYYVTRIPATIEPGNVIIIAGAAFLLTLAATIYPALRAARTQPADALRYE